MKPAVGIPFKRNNHQEHLIELAFRVLNSDSHDV